MSLTGYMLCLSAFLNLSFVYSLYKRFSNERRENLILAALPHDEIKRAIVRKVYSGFVR